MFDVTISGYDGNRSDRNQWRQGPCWSHGSCPWVQYVPSKALTTQLLSGKRDRACKAKYIIFLSFVAFVNPSKSFNEIVVRLTLNSDKFEDVDEIFLMRNNELRSRACSYWRLSLPPSGVACFLNALSRHQNEMLNKTNLSSETFSFPFRTCWFVGHNINPWLCPVRGFVWYTLLCRVHEYSRWKLKSLTSSHIHPPNLVPRVLSLGRKRNEVASHGRILPTVGSVHALGLRSLRSLSGLQKNTISVMLVSWFSRGEESSTGLRCSKASER